MTGAASKDGTERASPVRQRLSRGRRPAIDLQEDLQPLGIMEEASGGEERSHAAPSVTGTEPPGNGRRHLGARPEC